MGKAGIQIYTLRDVANENLPIAIDMIKDAGYQGVEFDAGMLTRAKPDQLKKLMDEANLAVIGLTLLLPEISHLLDPMLEYAHITGAEWLVMPWIDEESRKDLYDYQNIAKVLNDAGRKAAEQGLRFAYHIHGYEFRYFGDQCGFDVLIKELDPEFVELQVDTFWVTSGGQDVLDFSKSYIDRIGSFHLKDAASMDSLTDIEVGEGILDIQGIVQLGIKHQKEWFIVEQEKPTNNLPESIKTSCKNLQKMIDNNLA